MPNSAQQTLSFDPSQLQEFDPSQLTEASTPSGQKTQAFDPSQLQEFDPSQLSEPSATQSRAEMEANAPGVQKFVPPELRNDSRPKSSGPNPVAALGIPDITEADIPEAKRVFTGQAYEDVVPHPGPDASVAQRFLWGAGKGLAQAVSPESAMEMAALGVAGKAIPALANAPKIAEYLKDLPKVAKALDVMSHAALPTALTAQGAKGLYEQGVPKNAEQAGEAAVNALMLGLGAHGAIEAARGVMGQYPSESTAGTSEVGPAKPAEQATASAAQEAQQAQANAEALAQHGSRLAAEQWAAEAEKKAARLWPEAYGSGVPVDYNGKPATVQLSADKTKSGRPIFELVDDETGNVIHRDQAKPFAAFVRQNAGTTAETPETGAETPAPGPTQEVNPEDLTETPAAEQQTPHAPQTPQAQPQGFEPGAEFEGKNGKFTVLSNQNGRIKFTKETKSGKFGGALTEGQFRQMLTKNGIQIPEAPAVQTGTVEVNPEELTETPQASVTAAPEAETPVPPVSTPVVTPSTPVAPQVAPVVAPAAPAQTPELAGTVQPSPEDQQKQAENALETGEKPEAAAIPGANSGPVKVPAPTAAPVAPAPVNETPAVSEASPAEAQTAPQPTAETRPAVPNAVAKPEEYLSPGSLGTVTVQDGPLKGLFPNTPLSAEDFRVQADPVLDLHRNPTGWLEIKGDNGTTLIHPEEDRFVNFTASNPASGTDAMRAKAEAQAYAIDHRIDATPEPGTKTEAESLWPRKEAEAPERAAEPVTTEKPEQATQAPTPEPQEETASSQVEKQETSEPNPAETKEQSEAAWPAKASSITNKEVRDFPVQVKIQDGKIAVTVRYQRKPIANFGFSFDAWPNKKTAETFGNPAYDQRQFVGKQLEKTSIAGHLGKIANENERVNDNTADRIADAITSAVKEALADQTMLRVAELQQKERAETAATPEKNPVTPQVSWKDVAKEQADHSKLLGIGADLLDKAFDKAEPAIENAVKNSPENAHLEIEKLQKVLTDVQQYRDKATSAPLAERDAFDFAVKAAKDLIARAEKELAEKKSVEANPQGPAPAAKPVPKFVDFKEGDPAPQKGDEVIFTTMGGKLDAGRVESVDARGRIGGPLLSVKSIDVNKGQVVGVKIAHVQRIKRASAPSEAKPAEYATPEVTPNDLAGAAGLSEDDIIAAATKAIEAKRGPAKKAEAPRAEEPKAEAPKEEPKQEEPAAEEPKSERQNPLRDAANAARERLRNKIKGAQAQSGIDPQDLIDLATIGAEHIIDGAYKFADWAGKVMEDVGDLVDHFAEVTKQPREAVLRKIHDLARKTAKNFDVEAEETPKGEIATEEAKVDAERGNGETKQPATEQRAAEPESAAKPETEPVRANDNSALGEQLPAGRESAEAERPTGTGSEASGETGEHSGGAGTGEGNELESGAGTVSGVVGNPARPEETFPPRAENIGSGNHDHDYRIPDGRVVSGSPEARAKANIAAIKTLRQIQQENRPATVQEQDILARYVGWGAVPQLFAGSTPEFRDLQEQLRGLISQEEYESARRSTTNAHYTGDNVVDAMWRAMQRFGAQPGMSWLEPAVGTGNFFGRQPESLLSGSRRVGIEKDELTGSIAKLLHPDSGIDIKPFENAELPEDYFDAAISNVPFGNFGVHDASMKKYLTSSIHNYFFAKASTVVRPGGVIGFVTSRYTLDGYDQPIVMFRKWLAERADFIGAVRLPAGAFRQNAGTDVITDVIFLRRRLPGAEAAGEKWVESKTKNLKSQYGTNVPVSVNEYFHAHPEMVLGEEGISRGQFSATDYDVKGSITQDALHAALDRLPANQFQEWSNTKRAKTRAIRELNAPAEEAKLGGLFFDKDGKLFRKVSKGAALPIDVNDAMRGRIKGQLAIRDELVKLMAGELNDAPEAELEMMRKRLNAAYDSYVKVRGPLSDRQNIAAMKGDPDAPLLLALERRYEPGSAKAGKKASAEKAPIFQRRMLQPAKPVSGVSDAKEALSVTLNERGRIDWDRMQELTGKSQDQLARDLTGLVYQDPKTKEWQTAEEYLSGSVRTKLRDARRITKIEPQFEANVKALEAAQPDDIPPGEIRAALGVTWVPLQTYGEFAADLVGMDKPAKVAYIGGEWTVEPQGYGTANAARAEKWNTARVGALSLLRDAMNLRRPTVYDKDSNGNSYVNKDETLAARAKQQEIQNYFNEWLFSDTKRGDEMTRLYNDLNNDLRLRTFDGSHLTLPGMVHDPAVVRGGDLAPYQKAAVWRIISQRNVLLAHSVGSGKAQPLDAKILTPDGWTTMGDIRVGDQVIAGDGSATTVEAVFPQGEKDIFRVEFSDGSSTECCDEHLWLTQTYHERNGENNRRRIGKNWDFCKPKVRSTEEIRQTLRAPHLGAKNHSIPIVPGIDFNAQHVALNPYLLGVLIGDGCFRGPGSVTVSSVDQEVLDQICACLPADCELNAKSETRAGRACDYVINFVGKVKYAVGIGGRISTHPVVTTLKEMGMWWKYAHEKSIPNEYLFNSREVRLALLQGLMDTDGHVCANGTSVEFCTTSVRLADDVTCLVRSLGGIVRRREKRPSYTHRGVRKIGRIAVTLTLSLPPNVMPFRLTRKAVKVRAKTKYRPTRYITAVVPVGRKQAQCIRVSHPDHLYVTDDFIVTHNTFEMIAGGMELKRLGLIRRPMYVVPNATLTGWQQQFNALYPQARVLVFSEKDLEKDKRRAAMAQIATGDWDAVVVPHSSFQFLHTGDEIFNEHYAKLERELEEQIRDANDAGMDTRQIKRMEKAKERLLTSLQDKRAEEKKDLTVDWEQLGIDQLFVDESHEYRKLGFGTKQNNIAGIDTGGNQKTFDLLMKLRYTQKHGRGVVFATGTPVVNTMGELYSLMRYLVEPELEARGMGKFDEWAAQFGRTVDVFEPKPEGGGYQMKSRFAQFVNLPELAQLFRSFADVVTKDMLDIPRPKLVGGKRRGIETQLTPEQEEYLEGLRARASAIRADPRRALPDNMLTVYMDAQKMALDLRMVQAGAADDPNGRLSRAAEEIYKLWKESEGIKGTQLVLSDLGKPESERRAPRTKRDAEGNVRPTRASSNGFSVYDELIGKLIEKGIPKDEIAHIYQAKTKAERAKLFQDVNDGKIRVLLGSTKKMGVGVNVQERLYALHHLDIPHTPADLEQREGRIERQGNINPEVHVLYYIARGSLDEAKFGNVLRKAKFINAVMQGKSTVREAEDVSGMVPSLEMFQAMASGDPRVMRKLEVDSEVDRLGAVYSAWRNQQWGARGELARVPAIISNSQNEIRQYKAAIATREKTGRVWTVGKKKFEGDGISEAVSKALYAAADKAAPASIRELSDYNGNKHTVTARERLSEPVLVGTAYGIPIYTNGPNYQIGEDGLAFAEVRGPEEEGGTASRIAYQINHLDGKVKVAEDRISKAEKDREELEKFLATPWSHQAQYDKLVEEQKELVTALGGNKGDDAAVAVGDGGEIKDDSVAAEEPEGDEDENGTEEETDEESGKEDVVAEKTVAPATKERQAAGPMSQYVRGTGRLPAPTYRGHKKGWLTVVHDGRQLYSNGHILVEGKPPSGATAPTNIAPEAMARPLESAADAKPVRPRAFSTDEDNDRRVWFVGPSGKPVAIDAKYYDHVVSKYPRAQMLMDKQGKLYLSQGGRNVAVVMPKTGEPPKEINPYLKPGEAGSAPMIMDFAQAIVNRFGKKDAPLANYSGLGALERRFMPGGNLAQTERADTAVAEAMRQYASHRSHAAAVVRWTTPKIEKALEGSGVTYSDLRRYYSDSRLQGIRQRWFDMADETESLDDDQWETAYTDHFANFLGSIENKRGLPQDLSQTAAALLEKKDYQGLRDLLSTTFMDAGSMVHELMDPDEFDRIHNMVRNDPRVSEADRIYGEHVEKPMAEANAIHEGVFSDALGPAGRYIPLIGMTEEGESKGFFGAGKPYKKPENEHKRIATGISEHGYDTSIQAFTDAMGNAIRRSDKFNALKIAEKAGLWREFKGAVPETYTYRGVEYKPDTFDITEPKILIQNGKAIRIAGKKGVAPDWFVREIKPIMESDKPADENWIQRFIASDNAAALVGPALFMIDSANIFGTLAANTPFLGTSILDKAASAPLLKRITAIIYALRTVPSGPEAAQDILEMAKAGALPAKYAKKTWSQKTAEQTGANLAKWWDMSPALYGPDGLDIRARLLLWRIAKAANPGISPTELHHFVNQIGTYIPGLQSDIERAMKKTGLSPFITRGQQMIVNGLNAVFGTGPMPKSGRNSLNYRIWQQITGGALGLLVLWALLHKHQTGKYPWDDSNSKFAYIPLTPAQRNSPIGRVLCGNKAGTCYVPLSFFNPIAMRGLRAAGVPSGVDTAAEHGAPWQVAEAVATQSLNTLAQPLAGPAVHQAFILGFGKEPYLTSMRDHSGYSGPQLFPVVPPKEHGTKMVSDRIKAAFLGSNAMLNSLGEATGFLGPDAGKSQHQGAWWVREICDMAFGSHPMVSNQHAKAELLREQRTGTR